MLRAARQLTPLRRAARPVHTEARIAELGYVLPQLPQPAGAYSLGIHAGGWVYLAGHLPFQEDMKSVHVGRIGAEFTPEEGTELAKIVGLELISSLKQQIGDLDRVKRIVKVNGCARSASNGQARTHNLSYPPRRSHCCSRSQRHESANTAGRKSG